MATALDIIDGAMRKLGLLEANAQPSAEDAALGLTSLNDMCNAWNAQGIYTGFSTLSTSDSEFILDERHHGGVKAMLADYIAADYGTQASMSVKAQAYKALLLLKADYRPIETLQVDVALQALPSQRLYR